MRTSRWMWVLGGLAASAGALFVVWNWWLYPTYTVRYKLTVEVQVGDEIRTGSSVIEAWYGSQPTILGQPAGKGGYRGEAVFVDLGAGRNLIVTLTNKASGRPMVAGETTVADAESLPLVVFGIRPDKRSMPDQIKQAQAMGAVEVPPWRLPTTVTFRNPNDPTSIELVLPGAVRATLPGVSILRATAQITDEPLTRSIEEKLPWIPEYYGKMLDGRKFEIVSAENRLANALGTGFFSRRN